MDLNAGLLKCCLKGSDSTEILNTDIAGDPIYRNTNNSELQAGYTFIITGQITPHGDRFVIDFCTDNNHKDIALRLDARASTSSLGRNSRINNIWGEEETTTACPVSFDIGWNFEMQVLFHTNRIFIAYESMHVAEYALRVPLSAIKSIEIRGDIKDIAVEHKFNIDYPLRRRPTPHISRMSEMYAQTGDAKYIQSPTKSAKCRFKEEEFLRLPYYALFPRGFLKLGYRVIVKGKIGDNFRTIKVALQFSANVWPSPTIAVQLLFRSTTKGVNNGTGEPVLALNTYAEDEWIGEVICQLDAAFQPGAEFNLVVIHSALVFEIFLNKRHLYKYRHILNPEHVNTCLVEGDINLGDVLIESV